MSRLLVVALGLLAMVAAAIAGAAPAGTRCTWHDMSADLPASAVLMDVAAISDGDVWAVGYDSPGYPQLPLPLVMHWDGRAWVRVRTPLKKGQELLAVSAASSKDVWATVWNAWSVEADSTIHWNGRSWQLVPIPANWRLGNNIRFEDVVALPGDEAWAVGTDRRPPAGPYLPYLPLLRHWNGKRWEVVDPPLPPTMHAELLAVAGTSHQNVWAVGYSGSRMRPAGPPWQPLVLKRNGNRWQRLALPQSKYIESALNSVLVSSPTQVWVLGTTDTMPDRGGGKEAGYNFTWDGSHWRPLSNRVYEGATLARDGGIWAFSFSSDVYRLRDGTETRVTTIPWAVRSSGTHMTETSAGTLWAYGNSGLRPHIATYVCS